MGRLQRNKPKDYDDIMDFLVDLFKDGANTIEFNLTANEFYREDGAGDRTPEEILLGIDCLLAQTEHLIVVTNEVFSDGILYDDSTEKYKKMLGEINAGLAVRSDAFVEVVCSIPVILKGGPLC